MPAPTENHLAGVGLPASASLACGRWPYLLLAAAVFAADRLTKILIAAVFPLHATRPVVPGFFQIVHVTNEGMAFGLFNDNPSTLKTLLLVAASVAALGAVLYMLGTAEAGATLQLVALSLVLGGAAGNLFDRIRDGRVVDFLDFYIGDLHWPAFNVADSAIVIGAGLLLVCVARHRPRPGTGDL